jgi:SAM-dependent methyltransferase
MSNPAFGNAVAASYEEYMVPMVFEPYAEDLVARVSSQLLGEVLETAAGTGVVTRKLAALRANAPRAIVATDLSQAMLDHGRTLAAGPLITWLQADAQALPFPDASFDLTLCQFGAMFFPDRARAYEEARRVLRKGGRFVFTVWDRLETSDFAHTVDTAVAGLFSDNPPTFMARIPHGYFDLEVIAKDVIDAGFDPPSFETVTKISRAPSAKHAAQALVQGTPMRGEIEARDAALLNVAVDVAERALSDRFGAGPIEGQMRAFVVTVTR